jgi:hypothetical protein
MTLEFAAGVSCERGVGHHLQTDVCDSQTVGGVVRFALDMLKKPLAVKAGERYPGAESKAFRHSWPSN